MHEMSSKVDNLVSFKRGFKLCKDLFRYINLIEWVVSLSDRQSFTQSHFKRHFCTGQDFYAMFKSNKTKREFKQLLISPIWAKIRLHSYVDIFDFVSWTFSPTIYMTRGSWAKWCFRKFSLKDINCQRIETCWREENDLHLCDQTAWQFSISWFFCKLDNWILIKTFQSKEKLYGNLILQVTRSEDNQDQENL